MSSGELARARVGDVLKAMRRGEQVRWSRDYRCTLPDGFSMQIQVDSHDHLIRAVLFNADGARLDVTEVAAFPPAGSAVVLPLHRLRALVDRQLAT
jgi:hypothetical protein